MRWHRARSWWAAGIVVALGAVLGVLVARTGPEPEPPSRAPTTGSDTTTTAPGSTATSAPSTATTSGDGTTTLPPSPAVVVRRGDPTVRAVALTFDAGSDTGSAGEILDILAVHGVPATFGITGRWAEANPTLVHRMVEEGHQVVNHGDAHRSFTGRSTGEPALTRAERLTELARAEAAIEAAAGVSPVPWFRPPYGDEDESVRADVAAAGYRYLLMWTVDSLGWRGEPADAVVRRCLDGAVPGAIFLLHVGAASTDHDALPQVIDGLEARGYDFATAADLIGP